ncbi:DUF6809 family protein [Paenibacillus sp. GCM10012307]|uniref:DUF6809 family protein n=1 Tax=Paenibacillus TaxID=44249 RepID=UPI002FCE5D8B
MYYFSVIKHRLNASSMHVEAAFLHGFRLGANLLIEVMSNREELAPDAASSMPL